MSRDTSDPRRIVADLQREIDRLNRIIAGQKRRTAQDEADQARGRLDREARAGGFASWWHATDPSLWGKPAAVLAGRACPNCGGSLAPAADPAADLADTTETVS